MSALDLFVGRSDRPNLIKGRGGGQTVASTTLPVTKPAVAGNGNAETLLRAYKAAQMSQNADPAVSPGSASTPSVIAEEKSGAVSGSVKRPVGRSVRQTLTSDEKEARRAASVAYLEERGRREVS